MLGRVKRYNKLETDPLPGSVDCPTREKSVTSGRLWKTLDEFRSVRSRATAHSRVTFFIEHCWTSQQMVPGASGSSTIRFAIHNGPRSYSSK